MQETDLDPARPLRTGFSPNPSEPPLITSNSTLTRGLIGCQLAGKTAYPRRQDFTKGDSTLFDGSSTAF